VRLGAAFLLTVAIFAASVQSRVSRSSLAHLEKTIDAKVAAIDPDERSLVLGPTRGVYLEGYGAVFTAEVELVPSATPNPFSGQTITKDLVTRLKAKKRLRIDILKQTMRDTLIAAAVPLDSVPVDERIALAVTIPYFSWEDSSGLPRQILMTAPRGVLLKGAKGDTLAVDNGLKAQEF
jgi:hypothetical protein